MRHFLSYLEIENFKSIVHENFQLTSYTPLVGYNNAGKTNILHAIKWLLRKSSLPGEAFNSLDSPITVIGTISGVDAALLEQLAENHRNSIQQYIAEDKLSIKRVQNRPNDSATSIKLFVRNPNAANPQEEWVSNPSGIDNAIAILFPDPIHIGAMENSEEDVSKSKSTSTIGKLLGEIIGPIENAYADDLSDALTNLREYLDSDSEGRAAELVEFDNEVNSKLDAFFPDVNVRLHIPTPTLKDIFSKGTIKVYENQSINGRDVASLGHGAQRSIQMALIRHLAELKQVNDDHRTTTLLLIDEPELYLHPQAIEVVRNALKALSVEGYQIIFSTHSAMMVTHEDVSDTILIRKNRQRGTHKRATLRAAVPQVVEDAPSQLQLLFSLSHSTNVLFSEKVILTEGVTEERILPKIIESLTGRSLGLHKYALVKQGGVTNTKKSMRVLEIMDLPTRCVVDLDYVFKIGVKDGFIDENDQDLKACRDKMIAIAPEHGIALENGWPIKRGSSMSPAKAMSLLASIQEVKENINNLHEKLKAQNIWIWKKGDIESHLNLSGKNESAWAAFTHQLTEVGFANMEVDHDEIQACINWLTN